VEDITMLEFFFGRLLTSLIRSQLFWKVVAVWGFVFYVKAFLE